MTDKKQQPTEFIITEDDLNEAVGLVCSEPRGKVDLEKRSKISDIMGRTLSNPLNERINPLEKEIKSLKNSNKFYKERCYEIQKIQSKMRDPERQAICDILANGRTSRFQDGKK